MFNLEFPISSDVGVLVGSPNVIMQLAPGADPAIARAPGVMLPNPMTLPKNVDVVSVTIASTKFAFPANAASQVALALLQRRMTRVVVPVEPHPFGVKPCSTTCWFPKH